MRAADFRFHYPLRIRGSKNRLQRSGFTVRHLGCLDRAICGYWRALAIPYAAAMQQLGGDLLLRKTCVQWQASARLDEPFGIALRCERIDASCLHLAGAIVCGEQLPLTAELVYEYFDSVTKTSHPVPASLRALIEAYESGLPTTHVRTGDWATLGDDARALRTAVFIKEQGIACEDEWDAADVTAVHAVVFNLLGMPVATGRLLHEGPAGSGKARIGRMAVTRFLRGTGMGRLIVQALQKVAQQRGDTRIVLSAQRNAEGFYRRLGYAAYGEPYDEVGIAHIGMQRALP